MKNAQLEVEEFGRESVSSAVAMLRKGGPRNTRDLGDFIPGRQLATLHPGKRKNLNRGERKKPPKICRKLNAGNIIQSERKKHQGKTWSCKERIESYKRTLRTWLSISFSERFY